MFAPGFDREHNNEGMANLPPLPLPLHNGVVLVPNQLPVHSNPAALAVAAAAAAAANAKATANANAKKMNWLRPTVTSASPSARCAHTAVLSGNLYIFGGWNGTRMLSDLHVLHLG
jgi:hypothetical protein